LLAALFLMKSPTVARYEKLPIATSSVSALFAESLLIRSGTTTLSLHHCKEKYVSTSWRTVVVIPSPYILQLLGLWWFQLILYGPLNDVNGYSVDNDGQPLISGYIAFRSLELVLWCTFVPCHR